MRLTSVTVRMFRNFVSAQTIAIEDDVTCLVGKNESGKTTILKALHRINPANGRDREFDLTLEYPRWRLARDRRVNPNLAAETAPIEAVFVLEDADWEGLPESLPRPIEAPSVRVRKFYDNSRDVTIVSTISSVVMSAARDANLSEADVTNFFDVADLEDLKGRCKAAAAAASEGPLKAKAYNDLAKAASRYAYLLEPEGLGETAAGALLDLLPKFFYFSSYSLLPGESDLTRLAADMESNQPLRAGDETVVSLLAHAGEAPQDFLDDDYASRKAELQAASADLSQRAFQYWRQNTDLSVIFDTDNIVTTNQSNPAVQDARRILKIELRDARHGNVETNFATRSTGFQWFFSFFAAFSRYQDTDEPVIVLLDEPGTSLHGEAQKDFVRFIYDELGASKQTLYTTHSQHMVDPARYEKLRAVHDRATRENPDSGVTVTDIALSADRDTILPVESALGYSVSQHLFLGSGHHLAVEGSSDFVFLQRLTEYFESIGKRGLDPRLAIIPVGGADNMPAFVALLGRRLKVSALIDGARTNGKRDRVVAAAVANGLSASAVVACSEVTGAPTNADIEDMFADTDYLMLFNLAFDTAVSPADLSSTGEPVLKRLEQHRGEKFDHALPAHALTDNRASFFASISEETVRNFERLFDLLNATLVGTQ